MTKKFLVGRCIVQDLSDTDFYKLTMMYAMMLFFPHVWGRYEFTDRGKTQWNERMVDELKHQVKLIGGLRFSSDVLRTLAKFPFLPHHFLFETLKNLRMDPDEVQISLEDGRLKVVVEGPIYRAMLWEIYLMSTISELHYILNDLHPNWVLFQEKLQIKLEKILRYGLFVAEYGTRRRQSFAIHDTAVRMGMNIFVGTSNVWLAHKYGIKVLGTMAHEWFMLMQGIFGTRSANRMGLEFWLKVYGSRLGTALTDTFTTEAFLNDFTYDFATGFDSLRQDSGDPYVIGEMFINHWNQLGIDPLTKTTMFSDSLNIDKAHDLDAHFRGRVKRVASGIGTDITNDCGLTPLNMVIKLAAVKDMSRVTPRWVDVVKISDHPGKARGTAEAIASTKYELGIAA
ncbi:TPA: nicotinate phosphoribosyltransferase [Candidatus Falkowbacteria bacterium]|nr:nicotinate phosphoribosyltransferase [Candidatus Falkowbacteria bacterium]